MEQYVVGVDFGTLSGRAVVVRVADGTEVGAAACDYPHAVVDRLLPTGEVRLPPDWALQVPDDYREVLRTAVPAAVRRAGVGVEEIVAIGIACTSCTMVPTTADGTPLNELPAFAADPHAYVKLWKHHAAQSQADRITDAARGRGEPWLARYGGSISSEGQLPKALQLLEEAPEAYAAMDHFVEACDWIVWELCGSYVRSAGAAGYKGLLQDGNSPSRAFLEALEPAFAGVVDEKLDGPTRPLSAPAGCLSSRAARLTGLSKGITVAVGNIDAHATPPAAGAVAPGQLVAIMGTSTALIMNGTVAREVPGMSGVVHEGVAPGLWGYEAGQSGVGDIFGWFTRSCVPADVDRAAAERGLAVHELLTERAAGQAVGEHGLVALDWHSGNRSVLVDHDLSGLVLGLTLGTTPEDVYRALLEATAFGLRKVVEAFVDAGLPVTELVVAGGLLRNELLMKICADVTRLPLSTIVSSQGPALGAAIHAAVAAGCHPDLQAASAAMGGKRAAVHRPDPGDAARYDALYREYCLLHDHFGRGGNEVMHRLKRMRREATARQVPGMTEAAR